MFTHLTWSDYWTFMAAASGAYYLFVVATYYQEEIKALRSGKKQKLTKDAAIPRHPAKTNALPPTGPEIDTESDKGENNAGFAGEKENYDGEVYEDEHAQLEALEKVELLATSLKDGIEASTQITNSNELCQKIAGIITTSDSLSEAQPFRESLNKLIQQQASLHCNIDLDTRDLNIIWASAATSSKGKKDWKPGAAFILAIICSIIARAQTNNGNSGITDATSQVKNYFTDGCNLMYAVGAIVGLVGAVKVFNKWNSGEPDTNKVAAAWFGSCIFLVVVATILKGFFGV